MRGSLIVVLGSALMLTAGACASAGGGGGSLESKWTQDLGRHLVGPFEEGRLKIFQKHNLNVFREEQSFNTTYLETEWIPRAPVAQEQAEGITAARTRMVIRGRRVGEEASLAEGIFRMTVEVENEVTTAALAEWHPGSIPESVVRDWRQIVNDLELEVRAGVRR